MKKLLLLVLGIMLMLSTRAQITGIIYKDFNGNGVWQNVAPNIEPGVRGVIINAYDESNTLVNTTMSDSAGGYTLPYSVPVRLEFVIPSSNCITPLYDNTGFSGDGNNVRFVTANNTTENYAVLNPSEYAANKNPRVYVPVHKNGDPLAGGNTALEDFFVAYDWNTNSNTQVNLRTAPASQLGALYGVAFSKQSGKIFTSAFIKRHVGLGPLGPGGIYMITDTGSALGVSNFYDLDTTSFRPSAGSGAPAYGGGSSFNFSGDTSITFIGSIDPVSGAPVGLGVVGANNTDRGISGSLDSDSYDAAAFDQVGKVGLGDLEISDDGKFLFVMNLLSRKVVRMELDDAYNPTTIINITEFTLPSVTATNGEFRPFALGYHRNKLFVGGLTSGENGGQNNVGANDGTAYTDLYAYVFELNDPTGPAVFTTTPVLTFPLNFLKGFPINGTNDTLSRKWKPWTRETNNLIVGAFGERVYGTPMFTDIDFTDRGDMVMNFRDRCGDQFGYANYQNLRNSTALSTYDVSGDILIAGRDCSTGGYTLESNGSYTSDGTTFTSLGANTDEGPGGGEFFYMDVPPDSFHRECSQGSCAFLPGSNEGIFTLMDANSAFSGGTVQFSAEDATVSNRTNIYAGNSATGSLGKANGLGDVELAGEEPPLEIGNRVWSDDGDGIQDPAEAGIQDVSIELFCDTNNDGTADGALVATTTTDADGLWYFNASNVTDGDPFTSGNQAGPQPNKTYIVKIGSADWSGGVGIGDLAYRKLTASNVGGAGQADVRDNDAVLVSGVPCTSVTLGGHGENDHSLDFGFRSPVLPICLGDKVWNDLDQDGILNNGEVGVAGVTIHLIDSASGETISATLSDAYGNYKFCDLDPGTYKVTFTPPANYKFTGQNAGSNDSTDSDVDPVTGMTTYYTLVSGDTNNTVDAGIYFDEPITATVGDYVWYDVDKDGVQDASEEGVSGIVVTLCDNGGNPVATTITDGNGKYLFTEVAPGTYSVGFGKLPGLTFSPNSGVVSGTANSDANPSTGKTATFTVSAGDSIRYVDAGLYSLSTTVGSLGDRVWYDTDQNGVQDVGEAGVAGVTVTLYQSDGTTVISTTTTDAFGNYIFTGLAQGQYVVGFSNLPTNYVLTNTSGADSVTNSDANTGTAKTTVIDLGEGQHNMTYDAGIYTTVSANNNSLGDYVWNDFNKDGVQDASEIGVGGITVTLLNATTQSVISNTTTDKNGFYLFPDLPNGSYCVQFSNLPEGYAFSPNGNGTAATGSDAHPSTGKTPAVSLTGNTHNRDVDAGINIGTTHLGLGSLGDLVWYDMNNDGIQDATEKGIPNVKVILLQEDGVTPIDSMLTDPLGNYVFTGLPAGNYVVCFADIPSGFTISPKNVDSEGLNGIRNSDVNVATQKTDVIPLGTGEDNMNIDMGIAPPAGTASLGNCVWYDLNNDGLQTAGEPGVQGITVRLYNSSGVAISSTSTDKDGKYAFVGLIPETYSVGFENLPAGYGFTSQDADATGINGVANSDADSLTGLTTTVTLAAGDNNPNLDAGIVTTIVASVGDYVWYDANRDGTQDPNEEGVGGVLVTLCDNGNVPVASAITKPDGSYIFTNVTPGTYSIRFSNIPKGMIFTSQESNPTSNTGSNVNPTTGKTPQFTVTAGMHNPTIDAGITTAPKAGLGNYTWLDANEDGLQGASEEPLAGVLVTLYASDGTTVLANTTTDGNGNYSFINLTPGTYIVGFDSLPTGYTPTQSTGTVNDSLNSDLGSNGKTSSVTIPADSYNPNLDAGIYIGFPLPVSDLQAYRAVISERTKCEVNWFTVNELNTARFEIQRSTNGVDFKEVGNQSAGGHTLSKVNYSMVDDISDVLDADVLYYRVKLIDIDQHFTMSNVLTVKIDNALGSNIKIYPVPFKDQIKVEMMSEAENDIAITILDASGKTVSKSKYPIEAGSNVITVNQLQSLSEGVYFVKIRDLENNEEITKKIVK